MKSAQDASGKNGSSASAETPCPVAEKDERALASTQSINPPASKKARRDSNEHSSSTSNRKVVHGSKLVTGIVLDVVLDRFAIQHTNSNSGLPATAIANADLQANISGTQASASESARDSDAISVITPCTVPMAEPSGSRASTQLTREGQGANVAKHFPSIGEYVTSGQQRPNQSPTETKRTNATTAPPKQTSANGDVAQSLNTETLAPTDIPRNLLAASSTVHDQASSVPLRDSEPPIGITDARATSARKQDCQSISNPPSSRTDAAEDHARSVHAPDSAALATSTDASVATAVSAQAQQVPLRGRVIDSKQETQIDKSAQHPVANGAGAQSQIDGDSCADSEAGGMRQRGHANDRSTRDAVHAPVGDPASPVRKSTDDNLPPIVVEPTTIPGAAAKHVPAPLNTTGPSLPSPGPATPHQQELTQSHTDSTQRFTEATAAEPTRDSLGFPQVVHNAKLLRQLDGGEWRVGLQVPDLGRIEIKTNTREGSTQAQLAVERADVHRILSACQAELGNALARHNVAFSGTTLMHSSTGNGSGEREKQSHAPQQHYSAASGNSSSLAGANTNDSAPQGITTYAGAGLNILA